MAEKKFGVRDLEIIDPTGTPTIESSGDLIVNAGGANERLRITSDGKMLVGNTSARENLNDGTDSSHIQLEGTTQNTSTLSVIRNSDNDGPSHLVLGKSRGGSANSTAVVNDGDVIGQINFEGADGTHLIRGAEIRAKIVSGVGANDMPTNLEFRTNSGATSVTTGMTLLSTGGLTFGGDTAAANALDDYEEGTLGWRLQRTGAIGSGSNSSSTSITYTKIGSRVYVSGYIYSANTGGSTGVTVELRDDSNTNNVATLPYQPNQDGGFPITGTRTLSDTYRNMAVTFVAGQSQVYIYTDDGNNAYQKNTNNVQINSAQTHLVIQFCGSYTTDD